MKSFIKHKLREALLKEQMQSTLDDKFTERGETNLLLVATDEQNNKEHYLVLGVDLIPDNDYYELGYGFVIYDINNKKISHYMRTRNEVAKYLPNDLKGKITPKVLEMSKNLINKFKPNKIYMEAYESNIEGGSLKRFETMANFITSLGYKMEEGYPKRNNLNRLEWMFTNSKNEKQTINENTLFQMEEYQKLDKEQKIQFYWNVLSEDKEFLKEFLVTSRQKK